jgi:hypothetical protein
MLHDNVRYDGVSCVDGVAHQQKEHKRGATYVSQVKTAKYVM